MRWLVIKTSTVLALLLMTLSVSPRITHGQDLSQSGFVYTQSVLKTSDGKLVWVEYNEYGVEVPHGLGSPTFPQKAVDDFEDAWVMSAGDYKGHINKLKELEDRYKDDIEEKGLLYTRADFKLETLKTHDDKSIHSYAIKLPANAATVFVYPQRERFSQESSPILATFPIDFLTHRRLTLDELDGSIFNNKIRSLLFTQNSNDDANSPPFGVLKATSEHSLGPRVAFVIKSEYATDGVDNTVASTFDARLPVDAGTFLTDKSFGTKIVKPIKNARVSQGYSTGEGSNITSDRGYYQINRGNLCVPWSYGDPSVSTTVDIPFKLFDPKNDEGVSAFHSMSSFDPVKCRCQQEWDFVTANISVLGFTVGYPTETRTCFTEDLSKNFPVDYKFFRGKATLKNPSLTNIDTQGRDDKIKLDGATVSGGNTKHKFKPNAATPQYDYSGYKFDHDKDGAIDKVQVGKFSTVAGPPIVTTWTPVNAADAVLGVFLGSRTIAAAATSDASKFPNFTKVLDSNRSDVLKHDGLLEAIDEADLQNTDVLIFRQSTGEIIAEKRGLRAGQVVEAIGVEQTTNRLLYNINVLGRLSDRHSEYGKTRSGGNFSTAYISASSKKHLLDPDSFLQTWKEPPANYLREGETINVVLINRETGYIGNKQFVIGSGADSNNSPDYTVKDIAMGPPNLKIWAERDYEIKQGFSQSNGDSKVNLIGFEGAALDTDNYIVIKSEWLDHEGRPLPEELGDYGYTGRIAYSISSSKLTDAPFGIGQFAVKPGFRTVVMKVPAGQVFDQHYYVHVSPKSKYNRSDDPPDFSDDPSDIIDHYAKLPGRPREFVPFRVPVYDELADLQYLYDENNPTSGSTNTPGDKYSWLYRPEYQFSVWDLQVDKVEGSSDSVMVGPAAYRKRFFEVIEVPEEGGVSYSNEEDLIDTTLDIIQIFYDLEIGAEALDHDAAGSDSTRQLIFSIGGEEVLLDSLANEEDIETLLTMSNVDPAQILGMRIFYNTDAANVLWEYEATSILNGVELTQAIQDYESFANLGWMPDIPDIYDNDEVYDWDLPIKMIHDKPAAIRLYFNKPYRNRRYEIDITVTGEGRAAIPQKIHLYGDGCSVDDQRTHNGLCKSLDVALPISLKGVISFEVDVYNRRDDRREKWRFKTEFLESKTLTYYVYKYCDSVSGAPERICNANYLADAVSIIRQSQKMFPMSPNKIKIIDTGVEIVEAQLGPARGDAKMEAVARMLKAMSDDLIPKRGSNFDKAVIIVPTSISQGLSPTTNLLGAAVEAYSSFFSWPDADIVEAGTTFIHEIAHLFGRDHTGNVKPSPDCDNLSGAPIDWPYTDNYLHKLSSSNSSVDISVPFDADTATLAPNPSKYEIMSYCTENLQWPSTRTYKALMTYLGY